MTEQKYKIENLTEAYETLARNGIEVDEGAKVILHSTRHTGLKLLTAIDYLVNRCGWHKLGPVATESFLKAKRIAEEQRRKAQATMAKPRGERVWK